MNAQAGGIARVFGSVGRDKNGWLELGKPEGQSCKHCDAGPVCDTVEGQETVYWHLSDVCCEKRAHDQYQMLMRWSKTKRALSKVPFDQADNEAAELEKQAVDVHRRWQHKARVEQA